MVAPVSLEAATATVAAASRFAGRHAVHPLRPAAAQLAVAACRGRITASWAPRAQALFGTWTTLAPCLPKYAHFMKKTSKKDLKRPHIFMNESAQAALGEFYLCCALRLRPTEVEAAGSDNEKLLQLANETATTQVEPFFQECRDFVASYDEDLHRRLDDTTVWREVEDGLFWHHSFEVVAPDRYREYQGLVLPPEASWPAAEKIEELQALLVPAGKAVEEGGPARALAEDIYTRFLDASVTPVQATIRAALVDHRIIVGEVNYRGLGMPSE